MKDYEVTVRVRNNWLLKAMHRAGFYTSADLARASGVNANDISRYLNLKEPFLSARGWRPSVIKLSETLKCLPEDLAPPQHTATILEKNKASFEASLEDVEYLIDSRGTTDPLELLEQKERTATITEAMLKRLRPREQFVLACRFGLGQEPEMTLEAIGNKLGVSRDRIRQIEEKALRKLQYGANSNVNPHDGFAYHKEAREIGQKLAEFRP